MVVVAQLAEPRIVIPIVVGSNPINHPIQINPCYYTLAILPFDEKESIAKVFSLQDISICHVR